MHIKQILEFISLILSLVGAWFVSEQNVFGYYLWIFANSAAIYVQLSARLYIMTFMFGAFILINIKGIYFLNNI